MVTLTVKVPKKYVEEIDRLVREGRYITRSEAVRHALRELIRREYESSFRRIPIATLG